jgi:hypothetical protein
LRINKQISALLLKQIASDRQPLTAFEVWLLVAAHSCPPHRPQAEKALFAAVAAGRLSARCLADAVLSHAPPLRLSVPPPFFSNLTLRVFDSLMALCQTAISKRSEAVRRFASSLYALAFRAFSDPPSRAAVVAALLGHLSDDDVPFSRSFFIFKVDALETALDVIARLASSHSASLRPFVPHLKAALDVVERFPRRAVRKLFSTFAAIAVNVRRGRDDLTRADGGCH